MLPYNEAPLFLRLERALSWNGEEPIGDVSSEYCDYALDRLVSLALGTEEADRILRLVSDLRPVDRRRLLLRPQLLRRLEGWETGSAAQFIVEQQTLIAARNQHGSPLGDIAVLGDGECTVVNGVAYDRLTVAVTTMNRYLPEIFRFFHDYTGVIILRRDRRGFYSSSPERMIGATLLWNADSEDVSVEMVADALVHEAIHSLLDMDCHLRGIGRRPGGPWMPASLLREGVSRTISPWTRAPLSVPIYLHACVVWYGLFGLWSLALATPGEHLCEQEVIRLLRRASSGFFGRPEAQLQPFEAAMASDIVLGISNMSQRVRHAVEGMVI